MSKRTRLFIAAVAVFAFGTVVVLQVSSSASAQIDKLVEAVRRATSEVYNQTPEELLIDIVQNSEGWVFGTTEFYADPVTMPETRFFLAQNSGGKWIVAIQYTPLFDRWLSNIPDKLLEARVVRSLYSSRAFAQTQAEAGIQGNGTAQLSLPWRTSDSWKLNNGPHADDNGSGPRSHLDLNIAHGQSGDVMAALEGTAAVSCGGALVTISNPGGWTTSYFHIINPTVSHGAWVSRGQKIGRTSDGVGTCPGQADGIHVHFGVKRDGVWQDLNGMDIGGWTVESGASPSQGCLSRQGVRVCVNQYIYNYGAVGSETTSRCATNPEPNPAGVIFYDGTNCNGNQTQVFTPNGSMISLNNYGFDNRALSIDVRTGLSVLVYEGSGATKCVTGDMWDLYRDSYDNGTSMARTISAFMVSDQNNCTPPPICTYSPGLGAASITADCATPTSQPPTTTPVPAGQVRLYYLNGYTGDIVWQGETGFSNGPNANSRSMQMPSGWSVKTWRGDNRSGEERCWYGSVQNLEDHGWHNAIQSIEVFNYNVCPTVPNAPSNLRVIGTTQNSISIAWNDNSNNENGFRIYRWNGSDFALLATVDANVTVYSDSRPCDWSDFYEVSAYNNVGESERIGWVMGRTMACPVNVPPTAPTNLRAPGATSSSITIAWDDSSSNETELRIYKWNGTDFPLFATVGANATSFTHYGLPCDWTDFYKVSAANQYGESERIGWIAGTTLSCNTLPTSPSNLHVVGVTSSSITIGWTDNSNNESGFHIYKWNGSDFPLFATVDSNSTSFTHINLPCSWSDFYKVAAYNQYGVSEQIGWIEGTTQECLPTATPGPATPTPIDWPTPTATPVLGTHIYLPVIRR